MKFRNCSRNVLVEAYSLEGCGVNNFSPEAHSVSTRRGATGGGRPYWWNFAPAELLHLLLVDKQQTRTASVRASRPQPVWPKLITSTDRLGRGKTGPALTISGGRLLPVHVAQLEKPHVSGKTKRRLADSIVDKH